MNNAWRSPGSGWISARAAARASVRRRRPGLCALLSRVARGASKPLPAWARLGCRPSAIEGILERPPPTGKGRSPHVPTGPSAVSTGPSGYALPAKADPRTSFALRFALCAGKGRSPHASRGVAVSLSAQSIPSLHTGLPVCKKDRAQAPLSPRICAAGKGRSCLRGRCGQPERAELAHGLPRKIRPRRGCQGRSGPGVADKEDQAQAPGASALLASPPLAL